LAFLVFNRKQTTKFFVRRLVCDKEIQARAIGFAATEYSVLSLTAAV